MCDVCKALGLNPKFINGKKYRENKIKLYGISEERTVRFTLCFVHERDLFFLGEKRFLRFYPKLVVTMGGSSKLGIV